MTKHDQNFECFEQDSSDNHEKYEKLPTMINILTFLNRIAAKILNFDGFMQGLVQGRLRSADFEKYFGHFGGLILDLRAEIQSESRSFNGAGDPIGLEG